MATQNAAKIRKAMRKQTMLDALELGHHTSAELAEVTDIPQRTVRKFLRELREADRVQVVGTAKPTGGSPPDLYALVEDEVGEADG